MPAMCPGCCANLSHCWHCVAPMMLHAPPCGIWRQGSGLHSPQERRQCPRGPAMYALFRSHSPPVGRMDGGR